MWEKQITDESNNTDSWCVKRLDGASIFIPDIMATNKRRTVFYPIEAKPGEPNILYVP